MKKINPIALIILIALTAVVSHATAPDTAWTRWYNISSTALHEAYGCTIDTLGNIYVVGRIYEQSGNQNMLVLKYNSNGDTLWHWLYDGGNYDWADDCVINDMQQLYVSGSMNNRTALLKFNQDGDTIWTRKKNDINLMGRACAIDKANNVYIAGDYNNGAETKPFILKYTAQGDTVWNKIIPLAVEFLDFPQTNGCSIDSQNNIYLTGFTYNNGCYIIKCDSLGDTIWTRNHNIADTVYEIGYETHIDGDGNIYVSGEYDYFTSSNSKPYLALKYDSAGNLVWSNMQINLDLDPRSGYKSALDNQGNLYVTGKSVMIKYNSQGDTVWTFWIGSGAAGYDCEVTPAGELVICGSVYENGVFYFLTNKYQAETGVAGDKPKELSVVEQSSFIAYPNPFKSYATVKGLEEQELFVYNVLGQRVQACKGSRIGEKLAPGIYFAIKAKLPQIKPVKLIKIK